MNRNKEVLCSFLRRIFNSYELLTTDLNNQEELKNVDRAVLKNEMYKIFIMPFIFYTFIFFLVSLYLKI
jgi:hypothetical protein